MQLPTFVEMNKTVYKTFPPHCVCFLFAAPEGERVGVELRPVAEACRLKTEQGV